jgi:hypothetical protein
MTRARRNPPRRLPSGNQVGFGPNSRVWGGLGLGAKEARWDSAQVAVCGVESLSWLPSLFLAGDSFQRFEGNFEFLTLTSSAVSQGAMRKSPRLRRLNREEGAGEDFRPTLRCRLSLQTSLDRIPCLGARCDAEAPDSQPRLLVRASLCLLTLSTLVSPSSTRPHQFLHAPLISSTPVSPCSTHLIYTSLSILNPRP